MSAERDREAIDRQRKSVSLAVARFAAVAVAVFALWATWTAFDAHREQQRSRRLETDSGLSADQYRRLKSMIEPEMGPLLEDAAYKSYMERKLAERRAQGGSFDPVEFGKSLGASLAAKGAARLSDPDLAQFQALKRKMALASSRACACYWDISTCSEADIYDGLAKLSDEDLRSWMRLSGAAMQAEVRSTSPTPSLQEEFTAGLRAILENLPPEQRERFEGVLGAATPPKEEQCFAIRTIFAGLESLESPQRVRFTRALTQISAAD